MKTGKIIGAILIIILVITCITIPLAAMRGETKVSIQTPANIQSESMSCESQTIQYPFFAYDNSKSKNLKITIDFHNNSINAISLAYTLHYDNAQEIISSEAHNHANMNINFGKDGLDVDAFNAHYSKLENSMETSLYANSNSINPTSVKYFMINLKDQTTPPITIYEYQEYYEKQGFACKLNN